MDSMVTARMSKSKKESGNAILEQLGTNASNAINRFYDYLIEKRELPFGVREALSAEELQRRVALVDGIPVSTGNRFSSMDDDEIRRERISKRSSKISTERANEHLDKCSGKLSTECTSEHTSEHTSERPTERPRRMS